MFKSSKWIDQLVVVGEAQNFMAALIVPDFEVLKKNADSEGLSYADTDELLELDEVKSIYKKERFIKEKTKESLRKKNIGNNLKEEDLS